jgi:hypothetical protein
MKAPRVLGHNQIPGNEVGEASKAWSIVAGEFDPNVRPVDMEKIQNIRDRLLAIMELSSQTMEESFRRMQAYEINKYAIELTQPGLITDGKLTNRVEDEIAEVCVTYWPYSYEQIEDLKNQVPELNVENIPVLQALRAITALLNEELEDEKQLVNADNRKFTDAVPTIIYIKQKKPEVILQDPLARIKD